MRRAAPWFAVLGGMGIWAVALLASYPLVRVACAAELPLLVHLVRWLAMVVAAAATYAGVWTWRDARGERAAFVGLGGALISATGLLLLVVEDIATWVIDPCL
jgi:hypothetical protein